MKANNSAVCLFMGMMMLVVLLSSCAGVKTYANDSEKNLLIRTNTQSGSSFSKVRAFVYIYSVVSECDLEFLGNVDLDKPLVEVGIPAGRQSYLDFHFYSSSFLAGTRSTVSYDTLLTPRAGRFYNLDVTYLDDMCNVEIRESKSRKPGGREVEQRELSSCKVR